MRACIAVHLSWVPLWCL